MQGIIGFITVITAVSTFISAMVGNIFIIVSTTTFEEIFIKKYKVSLYNIIKIALYIIFLNICSLFFAYLLSQLFDTNLTLYNFIAFTGKGVLDVVLTITVSIMLIPYLYTTLRINKNLSSDKIKRISDTVFKYSTVISAILSYFFIILWYDKTVFNTVSKYSDLSTPLIGIPIASFIISVFYIFIVLTYKGHSLEYTAKFTLGSITTREKIKGALFVLDSRKENELILGDKKSIKECNIIYLFNIETDKCIEFKRDTD